MSTPPAKPSLLRTLKVVAWSFVGIRKHSGFAEDSAKINPLHVIAVGLVAALVIVVGLVILVNWVVAV